MYPDLFSHYYQLGTLCMTLGDYEDALVYFDAYLTDGKIRKMNIKSAKNNILDCLKRLEQINKI
jgi:hypothetical protein